MLELSRAIGTTHIDLPLAWARPHEDVVVAFDLFGPTNWQAHLASTDGEVLLAFPWHDHADRILLGSERGEFPVEAHEEVWDALVDGWWAWVKADGLHVYVAECNGDEFARIRRGRKLEHRGPGLVAVDNSHSAGIGCRVSPTTERGRTQSTRVAPGSPHPSASGSPRHPTIVGSSFASESSGLLPVAALDRRRHGQPRMPS